ncbi:MAG: 16S rRNA (guanine(527)-N(7))-methyltransferase RsmG [Alphaproteobacteria bacterium]|jgi:16S rRNA (guanine527-N7)-methyltransferase
MPDWLNVSRETQTKLEVFLRLVGKWNSRINLVSAASLENGWQRHILDSAQLWDIVDVKEGIWLDIGSGAGFPGVVIGILAQEAAPGLEVVLVESDRRKAVFLKEVVRQLLLNARVLSDRIEIIDPIGAQVVSARAFAVMGDLLPMVERHQAESCISVFLKGRGHAMELEAARRNWNMQCQTVASRTDSNGAVIKLWDLARA